MKHVKCKIDHLNTVFTIQSIDRLIDSFFALSTIPPFALQTSFHVVSIPFYIRVCVFSFHRHSQNRIEFYFNIDEVEFELGSSIVSISTCI